MSSRFILYRNEREWPSVLEVLPESYAVLRGCGKQELLGKPALGIIGARRCTPYGIAIAQMAGRIAAQSGVWWFLVVLWVAIMLRPVLRLMRQGR